MEDDITIIGLCQRCGRQYVKSSLSELHNCSPIHEIEKPNVPELGQYGLLPKHQSRQD
jgi:hypothetical protein